MEFGHHILEYRNEILSFLQELVAIPSVADMKKKTKDMPYGPDAARALDLVLSKAKDMGLDTVNVGNYAGHAEYHSGKDGVAGVLTHVDVVPAGNGWDHDPFQLKIIGDRAYGRGTTDDKGPAAAALFCLKALKDYGITGKRSIRCIFGSGEEIGMDDLRVYFSRVQKPVMAFTPDAEYGICNCEKGIVRLRFQGDCRSEIVKRVNGGIVANAVPDSATAVLSEILRTDEMFLERAQELGIQCETGRKENDIYVTAYGKSAHAMEPEKGINAVTKLVSLLCSACKEFDLGGFLKFYDLFLSDTAGVKLGIDYSDPVSGPLTMNAGICTCENGRGSVIVDIRYPVTMDYEKMIARIKSKCDQYAVGIDVKEHIPPLYLAEDTKLIRILKDSYRNVMGQDPGVFATGGGTYARTLRDRCVAYGPVFSDEPSRNLHQANEHLDLNCYMKHAQICLEAMYHLIRE